MIVVQWNKDFIQAQLNAIQNGEPLTAVVWNGPNMLMTAGALFFAAMSHGPQAYQNIDWDSLPLERREAAPETFYGDLHCAVEWLGQMAMNVRDGQYDDAFAEDATAVIFEDEEGKKKMFPVKGIHGHDDLL